MYLSKNYNFSFENVFLLGFSQGAMIAYALSVNYPNFYKKVIALSGKIPNEVVKYKERNNYLSHNFFCSHGIYDQVIPIHIGRESSEWLTKKEIRHIFLEFESQHGVSPENFEKMKSWIFEN
jgi:phospholipase/carboxylesterase